MVQYNASVRGMQGVAAKSHASYDLSRARASVTGQTTIGCLVLLGDNIPRLPGTVRGRRLDYTVAFTPDRKVMVITSRRPWSDTAAADDRGAVYDISEHTASYIRGHLRDETRTTASGKDVVWDLVLTSADGYAWHRTDWVLGMQTGGIGRCPAGTDSLIAPVGEQHWPAP